VTGAWDIGRTNLLDEDLVVIALPTGDGAVTYAVARLISEGDRAFAEAIVAIPGTSFAPPRRIALSRYSLAQLRPGSPPHRPNLYLYEGMIMPPPE
jgi:hypothetical protein